MTRSITRIALALIAACIATPPTMAQDAPLITNVDHRKTISLDGEWRAIVDPYETGYKDYRGRIDPNGYFRDAVPKDKSDRVEYAFDNAMTLKVPGDWNTQRPELLYYEGTIWYRKKLDYVRKEGKRAFLHFGAANYEARVYLNGEPLGRHVGGFTPCQFEVTKQL